MGFRFRKAGKWAATGVCGVSLVAWLVGTFWTVRYDGGRHVIALHEGCVYMDRRRSPRGWRVDRNATPGRVFPMPRAGGGTAFALPLWLVFFVSGGTAWLAWRWDRRPGTGCCGECGYDLTGNVSGVCPECGTRVMNTPRERDDADDDAGDDNAGNDNAGNGTMRIIRGTKRGAETDRRGENRGEGRSERR